MSTPKHTPGPWYAANMGNDFQGLVVEEQTGKNIAVAYDKRDVRILAAAPAMYEALQQSLVLVELAALEEWGRAVRGEQQPPTTEARDRLEKVKAALAQAEGNE